MRTISRIGLAAASSLALVLMTPALPANADMDYATWTSEKDGQAIFNGYGEHLLACDGTYDGEVTVAQLWANGQVWAEVYDEDGSGGSCGESDFDITDGSTFQLRACNIRWDKDPYNCGEFVEVTA